MGDVEVVGRVERRRKWTPEEKAALLSEIEAEGGRVTVVARRHRISESLLYNRRSAWRMAASLHRPDPVEFVPIGVIGSAADEKPTLPAAPDRMSNGDCPRHQVGTIKIALPTGARVHVDSFVNEKALSRVLRALKSAMCSASRPAPRFSSPVDPLIFVMDLTVWRRRHGRSSGRIRS